MASGKSIMPQLCGSFCSGTVNSGIPPDEAAKKSNEKQQENKHMTCRRDRPVSVSTAFYLVVCSCKCEAVALSV